MPVEFHTSDSYGHLPDPVRQSAFYDSVAVKRGIAWVIDTMIVAVLVCIALILTAFLGLFIFFALWLAVGFAYRVLTISNGSATWGMRLMAIEFRDWQGQRFDFSQALLHTLGYTLCVSVPPLQIISVICMFATERGQGLSDLALGTTALNKRA
ncbi:RDD family protein [Salipiger pallidus]|uniref:RDD family protein n=1 Tax=Salipiger pallidus TaxID=1775170 RepID=A0A8J3EF13_9RHOB|nr:RDD family protein [Salipiger pallidus]GGG61692.1 RDD family protein [Salipiger pallidus]